MTVREIINKVLTGSLDVETRENALDAINIELQSIAEEYNEHMPDLVVHNHEIVSVSGDNFAMLPSDYIESRPINHVTYNLKKIPVESYYTFVSALTEEYGDIEAVSIFNRKLYYRKKSSETLKFYITYYRRPVECQDDDSHLDGSDSIFLARAVMYGAQSLLHEGYEVGELSQKPNTAYCRNQKEAWLEKFVSQSKKQNYQTFDFSNPNSIPL